MQNEEITYTAEPNVDLETAKSARKFQDWLAQVDRERFNIRSIHFQSLDMFGKKVGFIKIKADVVDSTGKPISGIIFIRGGSVGILTIFRCEDKLYAVMTRQPRFPTGCFDFMEVPAGMLDDNGNFAGVAAKELHEELGLIIKETDLIDLTAASGNPGGIFLSPGGSEEAMRLFLYEKDVTRAEMDAMQGRLGGCIEESEQITLAIIPFDNLVKIPDAKTLAVYALYLEYRTAPKA